MDPAQQQPACHFTEPVDRRFARTHRRARGLGPPSRRDRAGRPRRQARRLTDVPRLSADDAQRLLLDPLDRAAEAARDQASARSLYSIPGLARFRVNVYFQRESLGAAFRLVPAEIKKLEDSGSRSSSTSSRRNCARPRPLVTGPTGSGKSTTLAAIIDEINSTRADHIITIRPDRVPPPPQEVRGQPA